MRRALMRLARDWGHEVEEVGAPDENSYDYPSAANEAAPRILSGEFDLGVFICGTGIGISIAANRHRGIRAALCCSVTTAELARQHNRANVLCLGGRTTDPEASVAILRAFLETPIDPGERHQHRVEMLDR